MKIDYQNILTNGITLKKEELTYRGIDRVFLTYTLILGALGSLMVFSAGYAYAEFRYNDACFFVKRQIVWFVLGIAVMFFASRIRPSVYKCATPFLYGVTLILLVLVLFIGLVGNGAQRWISIGPLTLQPS